jgi:hypothetical protein
VDGFCTTFGLQNGGVPAGAIGALALLADD